MKENKAMVQKIWRVSILYPKTSKEFYHRMKISGKYNEQKAFCKKQYSQENTCVGVSFLIKM